MACFPGMKFASRPFSSFATASDILGLVVWISYKIYARLAVGSGVSKCCDTFFEHQRLASFHFLWRVRDVKLDKVEKQKVYRWGLEVKTWGFL